jgi:hypothetical protein
LILPPPSPVNVKPIQPVLTDSPSPNFDLDNSLIKQDGIEYQKNNTNHKLASEYHRYLNALKLKRISAKQVIQKHYDGKTNTFLTPPKASWRRMGYTLRVVERVAMEIGVAKGIVVNAYKPSGSCCPRDDSPSWHNQNIAVDFVLEGISPKKVAAIACQLRDEGLFRGGVGDNEKYTHIDARGVNINW